MQNKDYRKWLVFSAEVCLDCYHHYFKCGMDLALTGELVEVAKVLEPDEVLELPFDILETMEDPLVKKMHKIAEECGDIGEALNNINNIDDDEIEEQTDIVSFPMKTGIPKKTIPTRKQVLHAIFKLSCHQAVYMTQALQGLALAQGYKIKNKRAAYFYNNKHLYYSCDDVNINKMARATELITELLMNLINESGFSNKLMIPKVARYYPFWNWLNRE